MNINVEIFRRRLDQTVCVCLMVFCVREISSARAKGHVFCMQENVTLIDDTWQNKSSPPSSGLIKPNPRVFQRQASPFRRRFLSPPPPRPRDRERLRPFAPPRLRERLRDRPFPPPPLGAERLRLRSFSAPRLRERLRLRPFPAPLSRESSLLSRGSASPLSGRPSGSADMLVLDTRRCYSGPIREATLLSVANTDPLCGSPASSRRGKTMGHTFTQLGR
jgi:hypothetical protein